MLPGHFHFSDVALNDGLIEADGLDEEQLEAFFCDNFFVQFSSTFSGRVGRVENGHLAVLVLEVVEDVIEALLTNLGANKNKKSSKLLNYIFWCYLKYSEKCGSTLSNDFLFQLEMFLKSLKFIKRCLTDLSISSLQV